MNKPNKPTINEVAEKSGVSRQTVSRVLNNRPDVAEDTRERVLEVIEAMNYRPSAIARSLSQKRTYNFGILTAGLKFIGPSTTLSGITEKSEKLGYGLLLKELSSFTANEIQPIFTWFLAHQVDGIIWAAPQIGTNREFIKDILAKVNVPIIFLTTEKRLDLSIVTIDNYYGAKLATEHLLQQGRRNIGHISGPLDWWEARERMRGWKDALIEAGIQATPYMTTEGNWSSRSGRIAIDYLLKTYPEMDAVFVGNDQMALSTFQVACEMKLRIPQDLAVVGFDGLPESEFYAPPLTTIHQNLNELGSIAVQELVKLVEGKNVDKSPLYLAIKPKLIIRESSSLVQ